MADRSGKTEEPTQRRIDKARREGQYASAREFISALQFFVFVGLLAAGGSYWLAGFRTSMRSMFQLAFASEVTAATLTHLAWKLSWQHFMPLILAGMAVVAVTVSLRLLTTRFGLSLKKLAPDLKRFNTLAKLREMPRQNLSSLVQALLLLPLFLWAAYAVTRDRLDSFLRLPLGTVETACAVISASLFSLLWKAAGLFLVFGSVDLFRQLRKHRRDLRMSRQEIREEMKEMEGNPQMKARIRRLQRDRARRQMMKEVPTATAVVVNPTHFAVAIRYQLESMAAPVVVAKGKNYLAKRIRLKAMEHQVPIIENPPLAQALYHSVEVGQEIPPHLYRAVAEILAYIFKLMNGRLPG